MIDDRRFCYNKHRQEIHSEPKGERSVRWAGLAPFAQTPVCGQVAKMTFLYRGDTPIDSVFGIHGGDENDMSAGFAYALAQSEALLRLVVEDLFPGLAVDAHHSAVSIQTSRKGEGITDIEVTVTGQAYIVFEAKKGMVLPAASQLVQYVPRCQRSECPHVLIVALTAVEREVATIVLANSDSDGIQIEGRSWRWLRALLTQAAANEKSLHVRWLLQEFRSFLEGFMGHDRVYSNMVYVVSLASGKPEGWKLTWIEIVEKYNRYFYAAGGRSWPPPPNYLGFRYNGQLQAVRHVDSVEIVPDLREHFPGAEAGADWGSHYLFTLGPPIKPAYRVGTGSRVVRSARVWCMLDTLLTCKTISEALTETEARRKAAADS